jgi:hypothetical protein
VAKLLFILVITALIAGGLALRASLPRGSESSVTNRPLEISESGYAGSQKCGACHPGEYSTWHASYHRTMTTVASSGTVVPSFAGTVSLGDQVVTLERQDAEFWATFDDPDWDGRDPVARRIRRPIALVTGSHHQQVFWYATGRKRLLGQLPSTYLIDARRWVPRRAAFMHPPYERPVSETGHWNAICIGCHATNGKPRFERPPGSEPLPHADVDTHVAEFGVACEACHRPASEHVRANRNPWRRYLLHFRRSPDPTIAQPARLEARASAEVCGQCHSVWELPNAASERQENYQGVVYKPGDQLRVSRFIAEPARHMDAPRLRELLDEDPGFLSESFWPDGMVSVTGREYNGLIESPCYRRGNATMGTMTCLSCHAMHKSSEDSRPVTAWADDQLKMGMDGNAACLQCHTAYRAPTALERHTHHRERSSGSECYNCHMPYTTYGLLKTVRSHQVSSPTVQSTIETGRLDACNLCHLDKSLAWTSGQLAAWYGTPISDMPQDEQMIPSGAVWMLRGDAAQRALVAASAGRVETQQASGARWLAPLLAKLEDDPYEAVRFIAGRSMRALPRADPGVEAGPVIDAATVDRLMRARNNRRVFLRE